MAEIFLSQIGSAVGASLLPQGISALGLTLSGAAIGQAVGSYLGAQIDNALFGPKIEGPRLKSLYLTEAREGVGLPNVYGRVRVAGQVIWATHFRERREELSTGGKGGPEVTQYTYSVSFALALCEGEIARVDRAWANGEVLALSRYAHRVYTGTQSQLPDPVIEAVEGSGRVPAYRGTAYIVFEDFPLDAFGNRLPQLSFELVKPASSESGVRLGDVVSGVNLIPASGEFVYATDAVRQRYFPGIEIAENTHGEDGRADMLVSLDQLQADLPRVDAVTLTVGWFATADTAETCAIRPGVEQADKSTQPWDWRAGGVGRGDAHAISRDADGHLNYGGTPDDRSVLQGLRELVARGMRVCVAPFLFMDTPGLPWRGRLTTLAGDGSAEVRAAVAAFMGHVQAGDMGPSSDGWSVDHAGGDWGYRRFVLHHAWLAKMAGGVESFLIGSEMVGLTRLRDAAGSFPFVEALTALARDVKALLGDAVKVSYAADWTEYGACVPGDGSGDVLFPLDGLWADPAVGFVGVDWYAPMGDWRDGGDHADALAGFAQPQDEAYLASQIEGGEGYDWYYASEADRLAQVRTPIRDTAHGEDWVFRVKDLRGWWSHAHHARAGGVRSAQPTAWQAGMKPVRFCEIGFPAVDRGTNQPNVFYDPKSVESALPHFSRGARDDGLQRAALGAVHRHWFGPGADNPFLEEMRVWAWDARPWPAFPVRSEVWADGPNWSLGHWLNGRAGLVTLRDLVADLAARAGVALQTEGLDAAVEGYTLDGPVSLRGALQTLQQAFGFVGVERDGQIVLRDAPAQAVRLIAQGESVEAAPGESLALTRTLIDKAPDGLRLSFIDGDAAHAPGVTEVRAQGRAPLNPASVSLPLVLSQAQARVVAQHLLEELRAGTRTATLALGPAGLDLEPGDLVQLAGMPAADWRVEAIETADTVALSLRQAAGADWPREHAVGLPPPGADVADAPEPDLVVMDLPGAPGDTRAPHVAAFAQPWPGAVSVRAGADPASLSERARLSRAARIGRLEAALAAGPVGRWDEANVLAVRFGAGGPASADRLSVLNGANRLAVETDAGWEVLSFRDAVLQGDGGWRLSGLLRGLGGSDGRMGSGADIGARCVLLDAAVVRATLGAHEVGLARVWLAGEDSVTLSYGAQGFLPWRPAHLQGAADGAGGLRLGWMARGADIPDDLDAADPVRSGVSWRVRLWRGAELVREVAVTQTAFDYGAAQRLADQADTVTVCEVDAMGREGPAAAMALV